MITLKRIAPEAIPFALEKVKRYRLLGEPEDAESICLDILETEPANQEAQINLLLSLTDKFAASGLVPAFEQATAIVAKLDSSYSKAYYSGIILERRAKFHLRQGGPGSQTAAYAWFVKAMEAYDRAISDTDPKNQDAILRWNCCARILNRNPDIKADRNGDEMLLDSYDTPH